MIPAVVPEETEERDSFFRHDSARGRLTGHAVQTLLHIEPRSCVKREAY